jgi:hypothetical protein
LTLRNLHNHNEKEIMTRTDIAGRIGEPGLNITHLLAREPLSVFARQPVRRQAHWRHLKYTWKLAPPSENITEVIKTT